MRVGVVTVIFLIVGVLAASLLSKLRGRSVQRSPRRRSQRRLREGP